METATPSRIVVVGLGASGLAAARLAVRDGASVIVTDTRPEADLTDRIAELPPGVRTVVAGHPLSVLDGADTVVLSPGVPPTNPLVAEARMRGLTVLPEIEFARRHRESIPLAAVTGSNGKSTVTTLIAAMLEEAGIPAAAGGNLGPPASDIVLDDPEGVRAWVLEVSSFQAEAFVDFRPDVAVFLNLSQDHLERHPDLDSYAAAKGRLFDRQTPKDWAVLNADDPIVAATPTAARKRFFSLEDRADGWVEGDVLMLGDEPLIEATRMKITGRHNPEQPPTRREQRPRRHDGQVERLAVASRPLEIRPLNAGGHVLADDPPPSIVKIGEVARLPRVQTLAEWTGTSVRVDQEMLPKHRRIGSHRLLHEKGGETTALHERILGLEDAGHSVVLIGNDNHICGVISIADALRPESRSAVKALKKSGIQKVVMLTGDNEGTARAVAEAAGVDHYEAELLPEDKVEAVEKLLAEYEQVAMVGDGVNDAPALARATVGIAMGGAGTDQALETADIVLMADDLSKLPLAMQLSRSALGIIRQNIALSLLVKIAFMALAIPGLATLWMAVFADVGASLIVILNGMRLLRMRES